MDKLKPEDLEWDWDWLCDCPTAWCPHCRDRGGHSNACGCVVHNDYAEDERPCEKSGFWEVIDIDRPTEPTWEMIDDWQKRTIKTYKETPQKEIDIWLDFGHGLTEKEYFKVNKWAKKIGYDKLTPYEELCKIVGQEPVWNCKTAKEWQEESDDIKILSFDGWESEEQFDNERIPWSEYCLRRRNCECDYSGFIERQRNPDNKLRAISTKPGQRIKILTGSCSDKTATVVENIPTDGMIKIQVDGRDNLNLISISNEIEILDSETFSSKSS